MATLRQTSFAGGELAPSLHARADLAKHAVGLRTCRNFIVLRQGGAMNRPGTTYVNEVKDSTKAVRLIPFVYSQTQSYVVEFGAGYIRLHSNGGTVSVSGVSAWSGATNYVVGDLVVSGGVNYYCIKAHINQTPPNGTYWYALTGTTYEIPSPYAEADLPRLNFTQSGDVLTVVHPSYAPRELVRTAHTTWTLTTITFGTSVAAPTSLTISATSYPGDATHFAKEWYWVVTAVDASGQESVASTEISAGSFYVYKVAVYPDKPVTIGWNRVTNAVSYNVYRGRHTSGPYGYVGSVSDPGTGTTASFMDDGQAPVYSAQPPTGRLPFDGGNNPSAVAYFQQRIVFGGPTANPGTIYTSKTGAYKTFDASSPAQADDALTLTLAATEREAIRHFVPLGQLLMLTNAGEWTLGGAQDEPVTPSNIDVRRRSAYGSAYVRPILVGGVVVWVAEKGSAVRDLIADSGSGAWEGNDLTVLATHLFTGQEIVDWAFARVPWSVIWAVRDDGVLLGLTYLREHEVWAWHRHDTEDGDGLFENVCVVPESDEDAVYVVVQRTVNGSTKRYVERFASRIVTDVREAIFLDSTLSFDGRNTTATTLTPTNGYTAGDTITLTASVGGTFASGDVTDYVVLYPDSDAPIRCLITNYLSGYVVEAELQDPIPLAQRGAATTSWAFARDSFSGLSHLEGKTVGVLGDGGYMGTEVVTSGAITLEDHAYLVHVGLPITADLETLELVSSANEIRTRQKNVKRCAFEVEGTQQLWAGETLTAMKQARTREVSSGYTVAPDSVTGLIEVATNSTWNQGGRAAMRLTEPLPTTVLSFIREVEIGG